MVIVFIGHSMRFWHLVTEGDPFLVIRSRLRTYTCREITICRSLSVTHWGFSIRSVVAIGHVAARLAGFEREA